MTKSYLEENLNMSVEELLELMQERIIKFSKYFGITCLRNPIDHWIYQEMIVELKPDFIIEIGNFCGASALALAHICDHLNHGQIIGVDISHEFLNKKAIAHPRNTFLKGDAIHIFNQVKALIPESANVLIIDDSAHTFDHTLKVLNTYQTLIKPGGYMIVEDSVSYHGIEMGPKPGPFEAIDAFIQSNHHFVSDRSKEGFFITWNPKGYLKRVS